MRKTISIDIDLADFDDDDLIDELEYRGYIVGIMPKTRLLAHDRQLNLHRKTPLLLSLKRRLKPIRLLTKDAASVLDTAWRRCGTAGDDGRDQN